MLCKICNNLLAVITTAHEFYFKCEGCQQPYKPTDVDSLRYEEQEGTNLLMYKTILQHAGQDPVNPKVYKDCKKCENNIVKRVLLGDDMRLINVCTKCQHQWLEGTEE
jgi:DNA-directed RNA polymerase subunit M/transcription elongation factor TFIIS